MQKNSRSNLIGQVAIMARWPSFLQERNTVVLAGVSGNIEGIRVVATVAANPGAWRVVIRRRSGAA